MTREAERDQLRERVDASNAARSNALPRRRGLAAPSDVWQFGASLDTLRDEDGTDRHARLVEGLVERSAATGPGFKAPPNGTSAIGRGNAAGAPGRRRRSGSQQLLKPGR